MNQNFLEIQSLDHVKNLSEYNLNTLPFIPLLLGGSEKKRRLNFSAHSNIPGVYLLKEKDTNKVLSIGYGVSLYSRIHSTVTRRKRLDMFNNAELCVIRTQENLIPKVVEVVRNMRKSSAGVLTVYESFKRSMDECSSLPLELLTFQDIYEASLGRPVFSFRHMSVPGVYIINENEKIPYVGLGTKNVNKALYKHFERYKKDREGKHYRANYFLTRNIFHYKAAVIEVPWIGRSETDIKKDVKELEDYLILYFDPRDNVRGVIGENSIEQELVLQGSWKPVVIEGLTREEMTF